MRYAENGWNESAATVERRYMKGRSARFAESLMSRSETIIYISPYLAWMAILLSCPSWEYSYLLRTSISSVLLLAVIGLVRKKKSLKGTSFSPFLGSLLSGFLVGGIVLLLWILPEQLEVYRAYCILGEPKTAPREITWLTYLQLVGSAGIIAPAEELFFRSFLYRWLQNRDWTAVDPRRWDGSAFLWMVMLFALEHNRIVAGAIAGAIYGWLYIRRGLSAAIVAHITTNLLLGLYVLRFGAWRFW